MHAEIALEIWQHLQERNDYQNQTNCQNETK